MSSTLTELVAQGQSPWIDFIRRSFMTKGDFGKLIAAGEIRGATSNPTIFEKAIGGSDDYDEQLKELVRQGVTDPKKIFDELAIRDIQMAADILRPVYDQASGADGFISLEVSPGAAHDTQATINEVRYLWGRVNRPNVMIKIPATPEGLPAIEQMLTEGININITLMFAVQVYDQVAHAYINALQKRAAAGQPIDRIASVASFFVSRVDTETDKRLNKLAEQAGSDEQRQRVKALLGKAAIANAKIAYQHFQMIFGAPDFTDLRAKGAKVQRPLWASTSTKNPAYRDVLYVEELIGPDTVDTMPPATIDAFRDHGKVAPTLVADQAGARQVMADLAAVGIDIDDVTQTLLVEGVKSFADSYDQLMAETAKKVVQLQQHMTGTSHPTKASGAPTGDDLFPAPLADAVETASRGLASADVGARLWDKDVTLWPGDATAGAATLNGLGWLDIPRVMESAVRDLTDFADEIRAGGFTHVVVLGMDAGSRFAAVLGASIGARPGFPRLHVVDVTDPATVLGVERGLDLRRTLFVVASKSGATLETLTLFHYFFGAARATLGDQAAARNVIAITDPGSALDASRFPFRRVWRNPPDMSGGYAALSYFGLLPAALMGLDVDALLDTALAQMAACGPGVPAAQSPGLALGALLGAAARGGRDKLTLVASPPVAALAPWLARLVAASIGQGIIPVANEPLGPPAVYGDDRLFVYLRADDGFDPAQDAGLDALQAAGQPVARVRLRSRYAQAGEGYRWQVATAVAGHILGINPFVAPDPLAGGAATKRILADFERNRRFPSLTPLLADGAIKVYATGATANTLRGAATIRAFKDALARQARPGDALAITAFLDPAPEHDALLQRLRLWLRDHTKAATMLDYGVRACDSAERSRLGGPEGGLIIQIVGEAQEDARIPGVAYTFGALTAAQSLGDYEALQERGRRVVRIELGRAIRAGLAHLAE
jgi:transaldolase/glucose-6-phosphate isomerase